MQAEQSVLDKIQRMQWKWYGHLLKMAEQDLPLNTADRRRKEDLKNHGRTMAFGNA
jgi:hypothetical protein